MNMTSHGIHEPLYRDGQEIRGDNGRGSTPAVPKRKWAEEGRLPGKRPTQADKVLGLLKRLHCGGFVVLHVKNRVQLGDLQQVMDFLGEIQQFEFAALVTHGGKSANQFADA